MYTIASFLWRGMAVNVQLRQFHGWALHTARLYETYCNFKDYLKYGKPLQVPIFLYILPDEQVIEIPIVSAINTQLVHPELTSLVCRAPPHPVGMMLYTQFGHFHMVAQLQVSPSICLLLLLKSYSLCKGPFSSPPTCCISYILFGWSAADCASNVHHSAGGNFPNCTLSISTVQLPYSSSTN